MNERVENTVGNREKSYIDVLAFSPFRTAFKHVLPQGLYHMGSFAKD